MGSVGYFLWVGIVAFLLIFIGTPLLCIAWFQFAFGKERVEKGLRWPPLALYCLTLSVLLDIARLIADQRFRIPGLGAVSLDTLLPNCGPLAYLVLGFICVCASMFLSRPARQPLVAVYLSSRVLFWISIAGFLFIASLSLLPS